MTDCSRATGISEVWRHYLLILKLSWSAASHSIRNHTNKKNQGEAVWRHQDQRLRLELAHGLRSHLATSPHNQVSETPLVR